MTDHWLTFTPKQFIDTFIPNQTSSSDTELRIRIFITTAPNRVFSTSDYWTITFPASGTTKGILSHVMTEFIDNLLQENKFKDSFQVVDFAFDRPVFDANKLDVAVIASCSQIPQTVSTVTFEELRLFGAKMPGDLDQGFVDDVVDRIRNPSPTLNAAQRGLLLVRQLSVVVSSKKIAGEWREGHSILVLRFQREGDDGARLILMQADAEKTKQWEVDEVAAFLYDGDRGHAYWVGTIRGHGVRSISLTEDWPVESVFANDGRLAVSWMMFTNQPPWLQPGQRPSMRDFALVDWLSG